MTAQTAEATAPPAGQPGPAPFRVLVTGSRDWTDRAAIGQVLLAVEAAMSAASTVGASPRPVVLVSGACPTGADAIAEEYADSLGWDAELHPADWESYGKQAGFRRNAEMVATRPDLCLAFIHQASAGASHTAKLAELAGIKTHRYTR